MYSSINMSTIHLLLFFVFVIHFGYAFNVDTDFAINFTSGQQSGVTNFGASVAISQNSQQTEFIIGAPKFTSNGPVRSGTVFKCELRDNHNKSSCKEESSYFRANERTKDMNLGFSLASQGKHLVVCSPTWTNRRSTNNDYPSGLCYYTNDRTYRLSPLENAGYQTKHRNAEYYYSDAVCGISVDVKEPLIALGAPGFSDWQGSVIVYNVGNLNNPLIFYDDHDYNSYMGYSVTFAQFFSDNIQYIAAGAPRSRETGCVYIFRSDGKNFGTTTESQANNNKAYILSNTFRKCGEQYGEYFGASLLAADINNDKYSDLIISAPFYSPSNQQRGDCGRIFVYMSRGNRFSNAQIITMERNAGARFGLALANLGDLNYDGYNDIAVGAPYEDNGRGAVYIYHGRRDGLAQHAAQRIAASVHFSAFDLKGFGSSLSPGVDVDGNNYPDFVVGSYLSETAILLRSRPVASLKVSVDFFQVKTQEKYSQINLKDKKCSKLTCFDISICLLLSGEHLPETQEIAVFVEIDSKLKRRAFANIDGNELHQFERLAQVPPNKIHCLASTTIYLQQQIEDKLTAMPVAVSAKIVQPNDANTLCIKCPILSSEVERVSESLEFETGCGTDQKCTAAIKLEIESSLPSIVEGLNHEFSLSAKVSNENENAFATKLKLVIKPILEFIRIASRCEVGELSDSMIIRCDIDNPLEKNINRQVNFFFGTTRLASNVNEIEVFGEVTTSSDLTKSSLTKLNYTIDVKRYASITVLKDTTTTEELYDDPKDDQQGFVEFANRVHLVKDDYSSVDEIDLKLRIPGTYKGDPIYYVPMLRLITKPVKSTTIKCDFSTLSLPMLPKGQKNDEPKKSSGAEKGDDAPRTKRELRPQMNLTKEEENAFKLDCDVADCQVVTCKVGPFGGYYQLAVAEISSALNMKTIESSFSIDSNGVLLIIEAEANINDTNIDSKRTSKTLIPTLFKRNPLKEAVAAWIVIVSSMLGLILLIIMFFLLFKFGFFQRKQLEDLKKLKRQTMAIRQSKMDTKKLTENETVEEET